MPRPKTSGTHVALLRGINVGGKNKLAMQDLAALFVDCGCGDVRTYIQSGNVLFSAPATLARRIPARIAQALERGFGLAVPLVVRSAAELRRAAAENPFLRPAAETSLLHVAFLRDRPSPAQIAALDPRRSPPDEFQVIGREIYLRCPSGMARTKLTNAYFDARLATVSTTRNWNTVTKLVELLGADA